MAILTNALIQALQTTVDQRYRQGWSDAAPWHQEVATVVPSSVRTNTYGWMQRLPAMRQWIGPRTLQNLSNHSYTLTNVPWELTVAVDRDDWEDDMLGIYSPLFEEMGRAARKLPDIQMVTVLQAGATTGLGFDGLSFFNNAHTALGAGAAIDNNFAATALTAANYAAVRAAMMAFQGEDGQPLGVMPNLLVVPPQLEGTARLILNAEQVASAAGTASETNIWRNSASLLVVPELAAQATTWYMFDVSRPIKPLIWQNRRSPALVSRANPQDSNVFNSRQLEWGVDGRGQGGYGPFFLAARAIA
jgi:phage major head subunit gpT-like protein